MNVYNQGDSRWRDKELGKSGLHMWSHGCYVCATAVALNAYGHALTPGDLCDLMNANDGFDDAGQIRWTVVEKMFPDVVWYASWWTTRFENAQNVQKMEQSAAIASLRRLQSLGFPTVLCVDVPNVGYTDWPDHAVTLWTDRDTVSDSDGGRAVDLVDGGKYGTLDKAVFGFRCLLGPLTTTDGALAAWKAAMVWKGREVKTYSKEIVEHLIGF